ncbi:MAG: adenine phosphoribosyltransferase [Oscillospiraceae bacterium]|nr:adenine phosphoribosyltransferase [Oscillospiraceae bacterium]
MQQYYTLNVAGLTRELPLCAVSDKLDIAAFIMFSDVELTVACAAELIKKCPPCDVLITAESKGIPLAYEMARQMGIRYVVARKGIKVYTIDPIEVNVNSITTANPQKLYLGRDDIEMIKGKRVLIVDDVISTGESLIALDTLVEKAGGKIVGQVAVLAEGDAADRDDIIFLEKLPLFFK